jgi:hypothetical protein
MRHRRSGSMDVIPTVPDALPCGYIHHRGTFCPYFGPLSLAPLF